MSFDLYVFDGDVTDDEEAISELLEDQSQWDVPLTPRLAAFVADLEGRYPGLGDDDDVDDSPWASWPLPRTGGRCCGFNIVWSQAERMGVEFRELCRQRGVTLYDPQASAVIRPDAKSDPKRRWWRRG